MKPSVSVYTSARKTKWFPHESVFHPYFLGTCICSWGQLCLELNGDGTRGGGGFKSLLTFSTSSFQSVWAVATIGQVNFVEYFRNDWNYKVGANWLAKDSEEMVAAALFKDIECIVIPNCYWVNCLDPDRTKKADEREELRLKTVNCLLRCTAVYCQRVNYPLTRVQVSCKNARFNHQENLQRKVSF